MTYNNGQEYKKWLIWKKNEEELLYKLGVDEIVVKQLYEYDYQILLAQRRMIRKQCITKDAFFSNIPSYDRKDIRTIDDLLDNIENELLFSYLSKSDPKTLNILLMKILGYSTSDIAMLLGMDKAAIHNRIHRLKKKLKKFR